MADPICPITGHSDWEPLCEQNGYEWIRFPESGYVRLRDMPALDEAKEIQSEEIGTRYIDGYAKKENSKRRRSRRRANYLRRHLKTGKRVMDVGSNVGFFVEAASAMGLQAEGLEINPVLAESARRRFPHLTFHTCSLEEFEQQGVFDGVYCSEVIEHTVDVAHFARQLLDLLRPGGALYLTTPSIAEYMAGGKVNRNLGAPDHKLYFNKRNIVQFLRCIGFSSVKHKLALGGGLQIVARR